jgi:hypothetical protein
VALRQPGATKVSTAPPVQIRYWSSAAVADSRRFYRAMHLLDGWAPAEQHLTDHEIISPSLLL